MDLEGRRRNTSQAKTLYFPQSPINIMSVTELAKQLGDEEGTGIDAKMKYSRLYWNKNEYSWKIYHSASNLPELAINEGNKLYSWYTWMFATKVDDSITPTCCFTSSELEDYCCATRLIERAKQMIPYSSRALSILARSWSTKMKDTTSEFVKSPIMGTWKMGIYWTHS